MKMYASKIEVLKIERFSEIFQITTRVLLDKLSVHSINCNTDDDNSNGQNFKQQ